MGVSFLNFLMKKVFAEEVRPSAVRLPVDERLGLQAAFAQFPMKSTKAAIMAPYHSEMAFGDVFFGMP